MIYEIWHRIVSDPIKFSLSHTHELWELRELNVEDAYISPNTMYHKQTFNSYVVAWRLKHLR